MNKILTIIFVLFISGFAFPQQYSVQTAIPSGNISQTNPSWGGDVQVSAYEPIGPIATSKLGSTIYIALNDTLVTNNLGIILYKSTNNGANWTMHTSGINLRDKIDRFVLTRTGAGPDSLYLFFMYQNTIYKWNVVNNSFNQVLTAGLYRTFDVAGSSTGALYLFLDVLASNSIPRCSSVDGGTTWSATSTVTSAGAIPRISQMMDGDSVILNYYNTGTIVGTDTSTAIIRSARYRQTANGTMSSANFVDVATETTPKTEYKSVKFNGNVWLIYTTGTTGSINIVGRKSDTYGVSYGSPVNIASNPNVDEYWFDANVYMGTSNGFDLILYSDSLQTGQPTNGTDKLMYCYSNATATTFSNPVAISEHSPGWSARGYIPAIVELPSLDLGAVWVGMDASVKKVYFDRYSLVSKIRNENNLTPQKYVLEQNYPNPFNPVTNIKFSIPKNGFVSLKVYDIMGKEVETLISKEMTTGSYHVDWNAVKYSSGIYFYKLESNGFTDTKKMILVK
ncbi:MAG: T9SS type A sorting domain-containing protein [Ignavibacteriae bacterium]|nr:T9SS type A sorting domain-containing protein [Ignavibacteriota bacterium]